MKASGSAAAQWVKRVAAPGGDRLSLGRRRKTMPIDATLPYDKKNVFARILRGELPCKKVYEDEHALAFHDINPLAPTHILVIPKGEYVSWDDFSERGSAEEIAGFVRAVGRIARDEGLVAPGYRLLANVGANGGQEVPHLHVHLFGGRGLGPMLAR
jgi:histidine triad (HIT) family protein